MNHAHDDMYHYYNISVFVYQYDDNYKYTVMLCYVIFSIAELLFFPPFHLCLPPLNQIESSYVACKTLIKSKQFTQREK